MQSFTPSNLETIIRTSDKSFNGKELYLSLICQSPLNTSPSGYTRNDFTVAFTDVCENSNISPPMMNSYEIPLYSTDVRGFAPSQNNIPNCPQIYYVLNFPTAADTPYFGLDASNRVVVDPTRPEHLGTYTLYL